MSLSPLQAKKVERHLKKHGGLGGFGYTDEDNPFGDARLSERFVWGKKIEKQLVDGADVKDLTAKAEQRRQNDRMEEIEKVQKRREQREAERAAMAEELEMIQRERAMAEAVELEKKEEEFHLEQAKVRARQRLAAGRPQAIDLLTNNLFLLDGFDPDEQDPGAIVAGLNVWQLKELKSDVETYAELDSQDASHLSFWRALAAVTEHELAAAVKQDDIDRARVRGLPIPAKYLIREAGWHESLDADVAVMLAGKTQTELATLEAGIHDQLDSGEAADPEYWSAVLRRLEIYKARAVLREFHHDVMQRHLDKVMKGADVPKALVGGKDRVAQARAEADRVAAEKRAAETETATAVAAAEEKKASAAAGDMEGEGKDKAPEVPVERNYEEIELPEEEEEEQGEEGNILDAELEALAATDIRLPAGGVAAAARIRAEEEAEAEAAELAAAEDAARGEPRAWENFDEREKSSLLLAAEGGAYSPRPLPPEHVVGHEVIPEDEDVRLLALLRAQVKVKESQRFLQAAAAAAAGAGGTVSVDADRLYRQMVANPRASGALLGSTNPLIKNLVESGQGASSSAADGDESRLRAAAARAMGDIAESGDAPFGGEIAVESQVYWWHEKYRPRKPKYFNRVHTGYDWNKYNKTHYDADNPPPKTVQGYKFNIFYPDLIDPGKAPTYKVELDPESEDGSTCIIRFSAGPPYEDIAFRIVNKDWELNPKRGFKCVFERGILHLYFSLKRQFYRR